MSKVKRLLALVDNVNEWAGRVVAPVCLVMIAILMWEITLRYVFNNPTHWAHETSTMLFGAYWVLAGGYTLRHRAHVNMDIIYNRLSLRGRAIVDLIGSLLFFLFCGFVLWEGGKLALTSILVDEHTTSFWSPPWYPLKLTIPIGAFLILLQGSAKFVRDLIIAITCREAT